MRWIILAFTILIVATLTTAPFLDLLAPADTVFLLDVSDTENPNLLAKGAATLWFQWQSWFYIALFCILLCIAGSAISSMLQENTNVEIKKRKAALDAKIKEQQTLNDSYRDQVEKEVRAELEAEYQHKKDWFNQRNIEQQQLSKHLQAKHQHAEDLIKKADTINKQTYISNKQQEKSNRSKLAQRDRLSEQKKLLIAYLARSSWHWENGEKVTYKSLIKQAKQTQTR